MEPVLGEELAGVLRLLETAHALLKGAGLVKIGVVLEFAGLRVCADLLAGGLSEGELVFKK